MIYGKKHFYEKILFLAKLGSPKFANVAINIRKVTSTNSNSLIHVPQVQHQI